MGDTGVTPNETQPAMKPLAYRILQNILGDNQVN